MIHKHNTYSTLKSSEKNSFARRFVFISISCPYPLIFFFSIYYFVSPLIFSFFRRTFILLYRHIDSSQIRIFSNRSNLFYKQNTNKIHRVLFSEFHRLEIPFFFYLVSVLREGKSDRKSFSSPSRHTSHASPIREGCTVYSTVYFVRSSGTVLFSICSTRSMLFYSASSATRAHRSSFLLATSVSHLIPRGPNAFSVEWRAWKRFSSAAQ